MIRPIEKASVCYSERKEAASASLRTCEGRRLPIFLTENNNLCVSVLLRP